MRRCKRLSANNEIALGVMQRCKYAEHIVHSCLHAMCTLSVQHFMSMSSMTMSMSHESCHVRDTFVQTQSEQLRYEERAGARCIYLLLSK